MKLPPKTTNALSIISSAVAELIDKFIKSLVTTKKELSIILFVAGLIDMLCFGFYYAKSRQLELDGATTQAEVIEKSQYRSLGLIRRKGPTHELFVRFHQRPGDFFETGAKGTAPRSLWQSVNVGSKVNIFYSKSDPSNFQFGKTFNNVNKHIYLTFLGVGLLTLVASFIVFILASKSSERSHGQHSVTKSSQERWPQTNLIDQLIIAVPKAAYRYTMEVVFSIVCCFSILTLALGSRYDNCSELIANGAISFGTSVEIIGPTLMTMLAAWFGFVRPSRSLAEKRLYLFSKGKELVISPHGLRISIALLEGNGRNKLRLSQQPYLSIPWDFISEFAVLHSGNRNRYYIITTLPHGEDFYIYRHLFHGEEKKILERCQTHLRCPITKYGKIA